MQPDWLRKVRCWLSFTLGFNIVLFDKKTVALELLKKKKWKKNGKKKKKKETLLTKNKSIINH